MGGTASAAAQRRGDPTNPGEHGSARAKNDKNGAVLVMGLAGGFDTPPTCGTGPLDFAGANGEFGGKVHRLRID